MGKSHGLKATASCCAIIATLAACVPSSMHVMRGTDPRYINDDVRFRATYYFRTFDYCWDADVKLSQLGAEAGRAVPYRNIIPETDTIYRYRMTGKANSLTTKVRFESGTLRKEEIEPFGKQISFSEAGNGFYIRDAGEVRSAEERDLAERRQWRRIHLLEDLYSQLTGQNDTEIKNEIRAEIIAAVRALASSNSPLSDGQRAIVQAMIDQQLAPLKARIGTLTETEEMTKNELEAIKRGMAATKASDTQIANELAACPIGQKIRKGFQVMGPEGIKTFDQDERLILAMSTSAKPLIQTLQEYSSRILDARTDATSQRLAVSDELVRALRARQSLVDATSGGNAQANKLIQNAIDALEGKVAAGDGQ